ncbi:MAG TPA: DUF1003 domain-containing protein [Gemmatimonadaceae bacterium]|nr:DUF1003 domain-containing protein [Gemmatimonadaceae bacterium]
MGEPLTTSGSSRQPAAEFLDEEARRLYDRRERAAGAGRAFRAVKAQHAARRTRAQALADHLTRIASSTTFLLLHLLWFALWILVNSGIFGVRPFDPFPFGLLTLILSIEAIVLTIFVLMSQGREAAIAELREEITLQVNLRIEEEVTKTLQLVTGLYARLGFPIGADTELRDMLRPLDAHVIEHELTEQIGDDLPEKGRKR